MTGQTWKASLLSVAGVTAVANGSAAGPAASASLLSSEPLVVADRPISQTKLSTGISQPSARAVGNIWVREPDLPVASRTATSLLLETTEPSESGFSKLRQSGGAIPVGSGVIEPLPSPPINTQSSFAPQFKLPEPASGATTLIASTGQHNVDGGLHSPDLAVVEQISFAEARAYFDRVGLSNSEVNAKTIGEFDFSQVERFARPSYFEVVDDPKAADKLIVRPIAQLAEGVAAAETPSPDKFANKKNDKSPADHPPQTGGSAEFE